MQIETVHIHGFRGIQDAEMRLHDYTLIVGANNGGKSSILSAICAFYEKDGFKFNNKHDAPFDKESWDGESWIEITYCLEADEKLSLKEEYQREDGRLRLRKIFVSRSTEHKPGFIYFVSEEGVVHENAFYGARNVQSGKIGDVIFIPAVSKVDEHTKLSGPSVLRDLLSDLLDDVVESSEAFARLDSEFKTFVCRIKSHCTSEGRSLEDFESALSSETASWGCKFELKFSTPRSSEIIKSLTGYEIRETSSNNEVAPEQCGSGFQRQFISALIRVGAEFRPSKIVKKTKDFSPKFSLVLFEEPEAFLHPPRQSQLADDLRKLASVSGRQVVCTSHSPHFVSKNANDIPSLVRVRRDRGHVTVWQIDSAMWERMAEANLAINEIAEVYPKLKKRLSEDDSAIEMEAIKHSLWLDPSRSGAFFAEHVLLVEGASEVGLVNRLIGDGYIRDTTGGLVVIDTLGKFNIHRFMVLFNAMGISHSVAYDSDAGKDGHAEINSLIRATRVQAKWCTNCTDFNNSLEKVLGIGVTGSHRKPQHILYCLDRGRIDDKKLRAFCAMIQALLPDVSITEVATDASSHAVIESKPMVAELA
ncbi:MAG: AAA family ATPase [Phycisphaerales bacterium]|nr:AAA family ATPase [Phycisphaerales bacterium]